MQPRSAAVCRGVRPPAASAVASAARESSSSTTWTWLRSTAVCRGVAPSCAARFTSARPSSSTAAEPTWPPRDAMCNGPCPHRLPCAGSAPARSSSCAMAAWLREAARSSAVSPLPFSNSSSGEGWPSRSPPRVSCGSASRSTATATELPHSAATCSAVRLSSVLALGSAALCRSSCTMGPQFCSTARCRGVTPSWFWQPTLARRSRSSFARPS
mmetsp:Transcript_50006/g.159953  ORF Transcript_50006/g.159953 Transcript_50006/m.159953 type:complete len:214 (+) Transcript_50006:146-787(+)